MRNTSADPLIQAENILDGSPVGILVTDADWKVRYVNQPLLEAVGAARADFLGQHLLVLGSKISRQDSLGELLRLLTHLTASPPQQTEMRVVAVQIPEKKFIRVRALPFRPAASASGYLLLFVDATREGEVDEMKTDFISVASHEMRTPMTSIKGSLELLLGGYGGELAAETTELLGICLTAVDRLIRLINDLLDISKIESGKMQLQKTRLNVVDCVKKSVRSLRSLAEANRTSITAEQSEQVPDIVADRDRIEQVITNLLSNALKYSPAESVVRVRVQNVNNSVRVSISDQGPGIPREQLDKVFDRFHQLEGAKKGTGLGLTISRALVEQHQGRIWVESEPGRGTEFHFEIPALTE
ncbi:MAG: PAS domain-containing protein [Acidobacteria bacterium]|nr:PAS domain-containing protein [Acidobacteriota bacterium]